MTVNERIERVRTSENLSRKDFGLKINKSADAVYNLERKRASINLDTIDLICESFYVNKNWLLNGVGDMYSIDESNINIGNTVSKILESKKLSVLAHQLVNLSDEKLKVIYDLVALLSENEK
ncbi:MAG: helix-turn-helix domain protein [Bacteriophage sp.]|nr:MAG: helix-turn-helix domain protein [Bacteriophage sp.]